ncbi:MAG: hypothetical protein LBC74_07890 [Planctomycetaceae bacterium]|nr:hypothetical protein [Planctomycetaceae bacterium]
MDFGSSIFDSVHVILCPQSAYKPDRGFRFGIGFYSARSLHAGDINTVYADGSAHCTINSVDRKVWQKLGAIDDNNAKLPVIPKRTEPDSVPQIN